MKNTKVLIIDPQNDFMDLRGRDRPRVGGKVLMPALPVPGARSDMARLASFITAHSKLISDIVVTLDSHPSVAIERTTFWSDANGNGVQPFTTVPADQVERGEYVPLHAREKVIEQLKSLEAKGASLMVWPVHCVTGTWGHNIEDNLAGALADWEYRNGPAVRKVLKGEYPYSEHYGIFVAETPVREAPSTQFNKRLAESLIHGTDLLIVAGEASSHCVAASVDQLLGALYRPEYGLVPRPGFKMVLLTDCMSAVTGFESAQRDFIARAQAAGVETADTHTIRQYLA